MPAETIVAESGLKNALQESQRGTMQQLTERLKQERQSLSEENAGIKQQIMQQINLLNKEIEDLKKKKE